MEFSLIGRGWRLEDENSDLAFRFDGMILVVVGDFGLMFSDVDGIHGDI
jgi:hypothetical protein